MVPLTGALWRYDHRQCYCKNGACHVRRNLFFKNDEKANMRSSEIDIQRRYYAETAGKYDDMHVRENNEHSFALGILAGIIKHLEIKSILDVGSGTGRALVDIKKAIPNVQVVGVEPSAELRNIGYAKGLSDSELIDGDATCLAFNDEAFDLVCEFGALHHIQDPKKAVSEMLRVSHRALFISDSNNFGQGGKLSRFLKQSINDMRLWRVADLIKTRGRGYTISDGDGVAYSYSVFNNYKQIKERCEALYMFNTVTSGPNLYRTASHVALLGIKHYRPAL
jgi:ubiquinone/menaquinone biosynthesis C-methylase UbiE